MLVACRTPQDGGEFEGSAEERRALLEAALAGGARGIDLEDWEEWRPARRPERIVRSHHALDGMPADLVALRDRLVAGGDVAKIAVAVDDLADAAPLCELLARTDQQRSPTTAFGLGVACAPTRLTACLQGRR